MIFTFSELINSNATLQKIQLFSIIQLGVSLLNLLFSLEERLRLSVI